MRRSYTYRRGGRRYTGYRYEWRSTPIYGTRQVGYATRERYWEPNWVTERRFDGYEWIRREEPVYDYLYRTVGTREVTYSTTEQRWGVIGSDHEWQLRDLPQATATPVPAINTGNGAGALVGAMAGIFEPSDPPAQATTTLMSAATPTPAPIPTPMPTPIGTPTFEELLEEYERIEEEAKQREYDRINRCYSVEDSFTCFMEYAEERYIELGIDLEQIAMNKEGNPLSQDQIADEFGDLVPAQLMEMAKAENIRFLQRLKLDYQNPVNYFPTYLNAL